MWMESGFIFDYGKHTQNEKEKVRPFNPIHLSSHSTPGKWGRIESKRRSKIKENRYQGLLSLAGVAGHVK